MRQRIEDKVEDVLVGQRIVDVLAGALAFHQPFGAQDAEALGDGGEVFPLRRGEFGDATWPLAEEGEQPQAGHIAKGAEDGGRAFERIRTDGG